MQCENFRQHIDSTVEFADGITAIVGPNGSGKSTVLEALAWALYGHHALRGGNDTVRSSAASGGSKVMVRAVFEISGEVYRIDRVMTPSTSSAELYIEGKISRTGVKEVTNYVEKLMGMDYQAFFNSFFTGQKQIEFMSQKGPNERARAISRMLGYDKVTVARNKARDEVRGLKREMEGLQRGLADPDELAKRKESAKIELDKTESALLDAEKDVTVAQKAYDAIAPVKKESELSERLYTETKNTISNLSDRLLRIENSIVRLQKQLDEFAQKRKEHESLAESVRLYEEAKAEYEKLDALREDENTRVQLADFLQKAKNEQAEKDKQLSAIANVEKELNGVNKDLAEKEDQLEKLKKDLSQSREQRAARISVADASIVSCNEQMTEVRSKRGRIVEQGIDGTCPTCERPLLEEYDRVLAGFDNQIDELQKKIDDLEREKLSAEEIDKQIAEIEATVKTLEDEKKGLERSRRGLEDREKEKVRLESEIKRASEEIASYEKQLAGLKSGFDAKRFEALRKTGIELKPAQKRSIELETELSRQPEVEKELVDEEKQKKEVEASLSEANSRLAGLKFDPATHEDILKNYDQADKHLEAANIAQVKKQGERDTAKAILDNISQQEKDLAERRQLLKDKQDELKVLEAVANGLSDFQSTLNERIKPELEIMAAEFLTEMTDGRYHSLELDETYKATIRDDGELKPVISGGEDDILNLALRLAIAQMIANRSGQALSLLVLDEVFGSLDSDRRYNVISLLQNLKGRFAQIVLISHVESIHDMVDTCLWVEFDEKTKTSRLTSRLDPVAPSVGPEKDSKEEELYDEGSLTLF